MHFVQQITWRPGIGDPSIMGWVTVAAYAFAAAAAGIAARRTTSVAAPGSRHDLTWVLVGVLMAFLCINKQLDLQSLFTDLGRVLARKQGWYDRRREVLLWFVIAIPLAAAVLTAVLAIRYRAFWRTNALLGVGLAFLLTFIVVRAISLRLVDDFLGMRWAGLRMNWILELTGIALVLAAAIRSIRRTRPVRRPGA